VNTIAVLQARTSSSRLPAKVLLPLAGMPVAVLAARRAANTGIPLLVATSTEPDDDHLSRVLDEYDVPQFRGSLDDTLQRVVGALAGRDDDTLVIRLTADNVFPDGDLLEQLVADFCQRRLEYLSCNGQPSGLPYGMSAEITRLRHLREAAAYAKDSLDREHVTPYIVRKFGAAYYDRYKALGKGHYRCTIDTYDDYIGLQCAFDGVVDPVAIPALDLVKRLDGVPYQPCGTGPVPRLVVGGAQLGMAYGIANACGQPGQRSATALLKTAIANGVTHIDTAQAYGASESVIGSALAGGWSERVRVVTKLATLDDCDKNATRSELRARVDASVYASCLQLARPVLDVLLLHRAAQLHAWNGQVWNRLLELRDSGRIKALGVSVQAPEELERALAIDQVGFVQMPFNLLDWRWKDLLSDLKSARERRGITIHVRSALLQGLLSSRDGILWKQAHVQAPETVWGWIDECVKRYGRADPVDLCLAYVRSQDWIDGIVVGMEAMEQLIANVRCFNSSLLDPAQTLEIEASRPSMAIDTLDPSRWCRRSA
jgi:aryl-alcohol dehydrogenase-like predicted oxidoreductase/spore coat polysaccharide biosynthesis protein SpsF (cytidylyltransferase family)